MNISLQTEVQFALGRPDRVEYWAGPQLLSAITNLSGIVTWTNLPPGASDLRVEAVTESGERYQSRPLPLMVAGPAVTMSLVETEVALTFASHTNFTYTVLESTNLVAWQTNQPTLKGIGESLRWTTVFDGSTRFYRVECRPSTKRSEPP
jgi:hypothetical protein